MVERTVYTSCRLSTENTYVAVLLVDDNVKWLLIL